MRDVATEKSPRTSSTLNAVPVARTTLSAAATVNGREAVVGTAIMLAGENSRVVSRRFSSFARRCSSSSGTFVTTPTPCPSAS